MNDQPPPGQSRPVPAEADFQEIRSRLGRLEQELADLELELVTRRSELVRFEAIYLTRIGTRIARLDGLRAKLAETRFRKSQSGGDRAAAEATRRVARESQGALGDLPEEVDEPDQSRFLPSTELRQRYRELARRIHPDLASTDEGSERRTVLMARLNEAYSQGDLVAMNGVALDAEQGLDEDLAAGTGLSYGELEKIESAISAATKRVAQVTHELEELNRSELAYMMRRVNEASGEGKDLLADMAAALDAEIAEAELRLTEETDVGPPP